MLIVVLLSVMVVFVIGAVSAALGSRMKHPIAVIANLLLIACVFMLGRAMDVDPASPSANGNPGVLLVVPLAGLGIALVGQLYAGSRFSRLRPLLLATLLVGLIAHQAAGFELQKIRYGALRKRIYAAYEARGEPTEMDSIVPTLSSMKMNGHLFHPNTYLLFVGWAAIAAIVLLLLKAWTERRRADVRSERAE